MKKIVYRIKRTALCHVPFSRYVEKGDYSYLAPFPGTGRQYRFPTSHVTCTLCGDYVRAINFESIADANRKLKVAAVKDIIGYYDNETEQQWQPFDGPPYKLDIVEIVLKHNDPRPGCKVSERVVKQIIPVPTVLDKLAAI